MPNDLTEAQQKEFYKYHKAVDAEYDGFSQEYDKLGVQYEKDELTWDEYTEARGNVQKEHSEKIKFLEDNLSPEVKDYWLKDGWKTGTGPHPQDIIEKYDELQKFSNQGIFQADDRSFKTTGVKPPTPDGLSVQ